MQEIGGGMLKNGRTALLVLVLAVCSTVAGDQWNIVVVDYEGSPGRSSSIKLDGYDIPHIAYCDMSAWGVLKYAVLNEGVWDISTVYDYEIQGYVTLALEPTQSPDTVWLPRIASFYDAPGDERVLYAAFNGTVWSKEWVGNSLNDGRYASMALDSSNNPHLSWWELGYSRLKYAYYNGSDWEIAIVDNSTTNTGYYTSIAIDSNDHAHISYRDEDNDCLMYASSNGINWTTAVVDSDGNVGKHTSLALDSEDHPHISYEDLTNLDLKYAEWNGASWEITSVDTAGNTGLLTSLVLDSQDSPHISYKSVTNGALMYAHWSGTAWEITTVDPSSWFSGADQSTSIDLDSGDDPHISYWDSGSKDLMYAYYGPVGIEGQESPEGFMLGPVYPNPAVTSVNVNLTVPVHSSVAFQVFDISGRTVKETEGGFDPGTHTVTLDGLETGVYFLRMQAGEFSASSRFLVLR